MSDRRKPERGTSPRGGAGGRARLAGPPALALGALLALATLLAACTGTSEVGPATLLVLAAEDPAGPHLQLVEDTFGAEAPVAGRFRTVPNGRLALPAPAVAFDLSERLVARDELFVLSRQRDAPYATFLSRVAVAELDPADASAFVELERIALEDAVATHALLDPGTLCPVALQVARTGRYAVLLNDPASCPEVPDATLTAVIVLDLEAPGGPAVVDAVTDDPVLPAGLYLAQAEVPGDTERAYYLQQGAGGAELQALALPAGDPVTVAQLDDGDLRDLAPALGKLVALQSSSFQAVDPLDGTATEAPVATATGAIRVVPDPTGLTEAMVVLAEGRAAVHASLEDAEPQTLGVDATGAALVPQTRFAYLLTAEALWVIDLLGYADGDASFLPGDRYGFFSLDELGLDAVTGTGPLTWVLAAFEAP